MRKATPLPFAHLLTILSLLVIGKVTLSTVMEYRHYFPPDFTSDFLRGREGHFWGAYRWAFYIHLVAGPASLVLGTTLVSDRVRRAAPRWHRWLGRLQIGCILLLLAPSGLWMARYAATGAIAATGLGVLAMLTAGCAFRGWRAAVGRRWAEHRRWMWRTFILLCSAIVIRLLGGLATVAQWDAPWLYPFATWASWLVPLLIVELNWYGRSTGGRAAA